MFLENEMNKTTKEEMWCKLILLIAVLLLGWTVLTAIGTEQVFALEWKAITGGIEPGLMAKVIGLLTIISICIGTWAASVSDKSAARRGCAAWQRSG